MPFDTSFMAGVPPIPVVIIICVLVLCSIAYIVVFRSSSGETPPTALTTASTINARSRHILPGVHVTFRPDLHPDALVLTRGHPMNIPSTDRLPTFTFLGAARNVEHEAGRVLRQLHDTVTDLGEPTLVVVVEGNSQDNSSRVLQEWVMGSTALHQRVVIVLDVDDDARTVRIATARNAALEYARRQGVCDAPTARVVMFECDDVIQEFPSAQMMRGVMARADPDWGVLTGVTARYYDIWALRSPWCPVDCHNDPEELLHHDRPAYIRDRQVFIPPSCPDLRVQAAYNGFAIYRAPLLRHAHYEGLGQAGEQVCDNVPLHESIRKHNPGLRLYICPKLRLDADVVNAQNWPRMRQEWVDACPQWVG